ncbi:hypothetical protein [Streptomyces avermitilis]|uniref:hypothetical protein n=1 Tax=Streptomyces avermitilis TaxID=33903 RepID=UPI00367A0696
MAGGGRGAARKSRVVDPELWARRLLKSADRLVGALEGVDLNEPVWAPRGKQNKGVLVALGALRDGRTPG